MARQAQSKKSEPETQYLTKQEAGLVREKKQVITDRELERIHKRNGAVTPKLVLDAARDEGHPLHDFFEWDDSIAGDKYRLEQAMRMIMASKMVVVLAGQTNQVITAAPEVRRLLPVSKGAGFKMRNEVLN